VQLRGEQGSPAPLERQSGFEIEPTPPVQRSKLSRHRQSRVQERADTASPGFEREQTPPVQGSRESRHCQSRVRERADTASPGFERERTPPVQGSRESGYLQFRVREGADHGLRRKPAEEAALLHQTG
jgi:hypothetical protein